jgi:predicted dehydrogenase
VRFLIGERWHDVLDVHRGPGEVRVQVLAWLPLMDLDDLYFERPRSLRLVWNYAREIGVAATLRKVASRHEERFRNRTQLAVGLGALLGGSQLDAPVPGMPVVFVAPRHASVPERVVLAQELVRQVPASLAARLEPQTLLVVERGDAAPPAADLARLAGWTPAKGEALTEDALRRALDAACVELEAASWSRAQRFDLAGAAPARERTPARDEHAPARDERAAARLRATLFGYGNYAKTALLPSIPPSIRVDAIHEVDPLQMPRALGRPVNGGSRPRWDTAPTLRDDERPDVAFIAGFHHTHAALAVEVLRRGGVAVIEKPLATDEGQLDCLLGALDEPGRRVFACFHKRYSRFNALARADLGVAPGGPVSYHCIVYEVPLPARHWYRWPSSRSCIVSNGCHWLDHFLFLNDFAEVVARSLNVAPDGTVAVTVTLANGAFCTMTLTHRGSERLGVREHVELRARDVTVTIDDGSSYRAESRDRVLRRCRQNRLAVYGEMYATICERIVAGTAGDSPRSVEASSRLALALDRMLLEQQGELERRASPRPRTLEAVRPARTGTG